MRIIIILLLSMALNSACGKKSSLDEHPDYRKIRK
jgi:hypothetical protein